MEQNYGPEYMDVDPYGVIVMDTMMEFNASAHSQTIPPNADSLVRIYKVCL